MNLVFLFLLFHLKEMTKMDKCVFASAPGKVILCGEHSIVYPGSSALAASLSLETRAYLRSSCRSTTSPVGSAAENNHCISLWIPRGEDGRQVEYRFPLDNNNNFDKNLGNLEAQFEVETDAAVKVFWHLVLNLQTIT